MLEFDKDNPERRAANNAYLRSLPDVCVCGHGRMEHYDGFDFCTWEPTGECDCLVYEQKGSS